MGTELITDSIRKSCGSRNTSIRTEVQVTVGGVKAAKCDNYESVNVTSPERV